MNMSKNQIVMAAIGAVAAVGAAVLGYLAFDAYSDKGEAADELESSRASVQKILRAEIAADAASVAAVNKNRDAIAGWSEAAMATAAAGDRAVATDVNAAAFKQKLVNDARELSNLPGGADGKIVKADFPFGLQDLVVGDKMPEADKLPRLQRQWGDIGQIVRILADCGVVEVVRIDAVTPAPRERRPEKPARGKTSRPQAAAADERPLCTVESYAVDFRAKPAALVKAVNALAEASRFFAVDSLSFVREGDMIATALGEGDKKRDDQPAAGRRRRRQRPDHQPAEFADAEAQAAENAKKGVANDPAQEAPFLVKAVISTFDFGTAAPAAGAPADTEDKEEEE